jgi:hypothetical protein
METIDENNISTLPEWILKSEFVTQFQIDFPEGNIMEYLYSHSHSHLIKERPIEISHDNINELLETYRFFGIEELSDLDYIYKIYVFFKRNESSMNILDDYPELVELSKNLNSKCLTCSTAALNGFIIQLMYFHNMGYRFDDSVCVNSARNGHLLCFKYTIKHMCGSTWVAGKEAAKFGHYDCLKYYCEGIQHIFNYSFSSIVSMSIKYNHQKCTDLMFEIAEKVKNDLHLNIDIFQSIIKYGTVELLKRLIKIDMKNKFGQFKNELCKYSMSNERLEFIDYFLKTGFTVSNSNMEFAFIRKNLELIKLLHKNGGTLIYIRRGKKITFEILKYYIENRFPIDEDFFRDVLDAECIECYEYLKARYEIPNFVSKFFTHQSFDFFKYLADTGIELKKSLLIECLHQHNPDLFKIFTYIYENSNDGLNSDQEIKLCVEIIRTGEIDILKYVYEKGFEWDSSCINASIDYNQFECFKFLIENGCEYIDITDDENCSDEFKDYLRDNDFMFY